MSKNEGVLFMEDDVAVRLVRQQPGTNRGVIYREGCYSVVSIHGVPGAQRGRYEHKLTRDDLLMLHELPLNPRRLDGEDDMGQTVMGFADLEDDKPSVV